MNTSTFHLLFLLLCTYRGEVQGEQHNRQASHITKTKLHEKFNASLSDSCPEAADILPCVCSSSDSLTMDCSEVKDEEELRRVFTATFPTKDFMMFNMIGNKDVVVLEDGVFGNISFRIVNIWRSVVETVRDDALTPSLSTLGILDFSFTQLAVFPFDRLPKFTRLFHLSIESSEIHSFPPLFSSSLKFLHLDLNSISRLSPNAFTNLAAISIIGLEENQLTDIAPGTFTSLPNLFSLNLAGNKLSYLHSLTFALTATHTLPGDLNLQNNIINHVEVDAFKGVQAPATINLRNNALTRLEESVWKPVLQKGITVLFKGNAISCGCDIAWLVRDPQLLTKAKEATCADGTLLMDLNPADFDICG